MSRPSYQQTLLFLYEQLPMFQRIGPAAFKKDLGNTLALLKVLDQPHLRFPSVHIAGTNGKGSVSHMLAGVFQEAGYRTGLYTSPHYRDFRERIKLDGKLVSEVFVVDFVERIRPHLHTIKPSFFEITVAMAFGYFADQEVDIAIVETGLGGRLDSTNVLRPELSIITNIGLDHQQFLGDTLPEIATEKAGIIKEGVPVVIGQTQEGLDELFRQVANGRRSEIYFADQRWQARPVSEELEATVYSVSRAGERVYPKLRLPSRGSYQRYNLQTSLMALELLSDQWRLDPELIESGLSRFVQNTGMLGRWQILGKEPLVITDSAHNLDGVGMLIPQLLAIPHHRLHMVWGTVSDKDPGSVLSLLPTEATYYFVKPEVPRGLTADELRRKAAEIGLQGKAYSSVAAGLEAARSVAEQEDLIFVGGSIFVVAEVV